MYSRIKQNKFRLSKFTAITYSIFLLTWLIFGIMSSKVDPSLKEKYFIVLMGYLIVGSLFTLYSTIKKIDIFEPLPFITIIYIMFFSISPMLDLITDNTYFFGHNVVDGTIKATMMYITGYFAFFIGYLMKKNNKSNKKFLRDTPVTSTQKVVWLNMVMWGVGLVSSVILLISYGQSIIYILSFGTIGTVSNSETSLSFNFLGLLSYTMVVPWMYIITNSKSRGLKLVITLITVSIFFIRGFRFILLIMVIAPIVFYYLRHNKKPSIIMGTTVVTILLLIIGIVGFVRGDVRNGNKVNWTEFGFDQIWYGLESNFSIYKAFYKMVEVIPESFAYTMGSQLSYTLTIMIPRFLWPSKPDTPLREVLEAVLGDYAVLAGTTWPNIGEYYSEFGIIGVVIFMYLFGLLSKTSTKLYVTKDLNSHKLIAYSILFPMYLQIVIRGYTPTNFWMLVFLLIPILVNWRFGEQKSYTNINNFRS